MSYTLKIESPAQALQELVSYAGQSRADKLCEILRGVWATMPKHNAYRVTLFALGMSGVTGRGMVRGIIRAL